MDQSAKVVAEVVHHILQGWISAYVVEHTSMHCLSRRYDST